MNGILQKGKNSLKLNRLQDFANRIIKQDKNSIKIESN